MQEMFGLEMLLGALIARGPHLLMAGLGLILFITRREQRPTAATLILISLILSTLFSVIHPFVWDVLVKVLQPETQLAYHLVSAVTSLPHALTYGMLIWAGFMPDQPGSGGRHRPYDDADDEWSDNSRRRR